MPEQPNPYSPEAEATVICSMLLHSEDRSIALDLFADRDFYTPTCRSVFSILSEWTASARPILLAEVAAEFPNPDKYNAVLGYVNGDFQEASAIVMDLSGRRRFLEALAVAQASVYDRGVPVEQIREELYEAGASTRYEPYRSEAIEDFLKTQSEDQAWVLPGLLRRLERVVLVAGEGVGKSHLLRQIAVRASQGLHPWTPEPIAPIRVLLVDSENTRAQITAAIGPMWDRVQRDSDCIDPDRLALMVLRGTQIDLGTPRGMAALTENIAAHRPDLVTLGPLYKITGFDTQDEKASHDFVTRLDRLCDRFGCSLMIEAHAPHGESAKVRLLRPFGSSLWLRWPDFGLSMTMSADTGLLTVLSWRGARDRTREWPSKLRIGGTWPFIAA